MDIRLATSSPSLRNIPVDLLSPFSQTNTQGSCNNITCDHDPNDVDCLELREHKRHTGPVGVYWTFDPEGDNPPRYAPQQATPASIHASCQNLTNSIQSSLRDLIMAPTSSVSNPVQLGKRAILSLLHRESLLLETETHLDALCRTTKRIASRWTNEAEQLPKSNNWIPPPVVPSSTTSIQNEVKTEKEADREHDVVGSDDEAEAVEWRPTEITLNDALQEPSTSLTRQQFPEDALS